MIQTARLLALYVAVVLCIAAIVDRSWAYADFAGSTRPYESAARIEVGTRDFIEIRGSHYRTTNVDALRELNGEGRGFETKGRYAFYAAIVAAIAFAAASELVRRRKLQALHWRIALAVPALVSLVCAARFTDHLTKLRYLEIGWGAYAAIAGAIIGAAALFADLFQGARP